MKIELQDKLVEKYPKIFAEVGMTVEESNMAWGLCVEDGWYWLIDQLCDHLQHDIDKNGLPQVVASQVKEKFAGLRFYINGTTERQYAVISFAEYLSFSICEYCGSTEEVAQISGGWLKTKCKECLQKGIEVSTE